MVNDLHATLPDAAWGEGPAANVPAGDVVAWFAQHAARDPRALAVRDGNRTLDYGTLAAQSAQVAEVLRARGIGAGSVVALGLERSLEFVVAMLAVVQAGAAWLPLDIGHPPERLAWIVADAQAALVLTRECERLVSADVATLTLEAALACARAERPEAGVASGLSALAQEDDRLAYVIYTSGSTGQPKGVDVGHAALANVVAWHVQALAIEPGTRTAQIAGAGFDASMLEWWGALAAGASLHIVADEVRIAPPALVQWLGAEAIEVAFLPTPLAHACWNETWPDALALRAVFVGGDALRRVPPAGLPFTVFNDYGPTEAAVVSTCDRVQPGQVRVPDIGSPIPGLRVRIVDADGQRVPVEVVGELQIGGVGLARGYRGRPDLTAERFVHDSYGTRWYRSGDRARWRADGTLGFIGRDDDQVKLRGFRIELGEIQSALAGLDGVRRAAVRVHGEDGERRLVGFVEADALSADDVQAQLGRWLPPYMVPATVHVLAALPLDRNGKFDGAALHALDDAATVSAHVAPATDTERRLAAIWAELFLRDAAGIGASARFFAIGGHSLLLMRLISAVKHAFGVVLPLKTLFEAADLRAMAALVDAALAAAAPAAEPTEELEW